MGKQYELYTKGCCCKKKKYKVITTDQDLSNLDLVETNREWQGDKKFQFNVDEKWDDLEFAKMICALHLITKLYYE